MTKMVTTTTPLKVFSGTERPSTLKLSMQLLVAPALSSSLIDIDPFYGKVKFGHIGLCIVA